MPAVGGGIRGGTNPETGQAKPDNRCPDRDFCTVNFLTVATHEQDCGEADAGCTHIKYDKVERISRLSKSISKWCIAAVMVAIQAGVFRVEVVRKVECVPDGYNGQKAAKYGCGTGSIAFE